MPTLQPNQPLVTEQPFLVVDGGLPPGQYRFRLVVEDAHGNESLPAEKVVTVTPRE